MSLSTPLPQLPQPRPASGNTPSARNRSVQRLRQAVTSVRQNFFAPSPSLSSSSLPASSTKGKSTHTNSPQRDHASSHSNNNNQNNVVSPEQRQQFFSVPRPMIIRMPLSRARTPNPTNFNNADLTFFGGGNNSSGNNRDDPSSSQNNANNFAASSIAPVPASPYSFYTGDPSPQLANALCRGSRVVRAHGLISVIDQPVSDQSVTMKLFGAFGNKSGLSNNNNNNGNSSKKKSKNSKTNQQQQRQDANPNSSSRPPSGGSGRKLKRVDSASSNTSSVLAMNMTAVVNSPQLAAGANFTPEQEARIAERTAQLLSGEVKALLEPTSIFFQPYLSDAPLAAAQIVDEFSAGNARKKLIGVLHRTSGNDSALISLKKAQSIVKKVKKRADDEADKLKKSQVGVEGESGEKGNNNNNAGGEGGDENNDEEASAKRRRNNKDKDPEEVAREKAETEEADKVRAACKLLLMGMDGKDGGEEKKKKQPTASSDPMLAASQKAKDKNAKPPRQDFPNHSILFGKLRKILLNLSVHPSTIPSASQSTKQRVSSPSTKKDTTKKNNNAKKNNNDDSPLDNDSDDDNGETKEFVLKKEFTDHDISILPRSLIRVLCDLMDISPSSVPQWELLARREYRIQEAERNTKDPRKLKSKAKSQNAAPAQSNASNGMFENNNNNNNNNGDGSANDPDNNNNNNTTMSAGLQKTDSGREIPYPAATTNNQDALLLEENASFSGNNNNTVSPSSMMNNFNILQTSSFQLSWPSLTTLGRQVVVGTTLRSLSEEFTASFFDVPTALLLLSSSLQFSNQTLHSSIDHNNIVQQQHSAGDGGRPIVSELHLNPSLLVSACSKQQSLTLNSILSQQHHANSSSVNNQLSIPRIMQEMKIVGVNNWQPVLQVGQVSQLVRAFLTTHQGSTVDLVVSSAFNFVYTLVEHRHDWTKICNSTEDFLQKTMERNEEVERVNQILAREGALTPAVGTLKNASLSNAARVARRNIFLKRRKEKALRDREEARRNGGGGGGGGLAGGRHGSVMFLAENSNNNNNTTNPKSPTVFSAASPAKTASSSVKKSPPQSPTTQNQPEEVAENSKNPSDGNLGENASLSTPTKDPNNNNDATFLGISPSPAGVLFPQSNNDDDNSNNTVNNKYGIEDWELEIDDNMYPLEVQYDDSMLKLALVSERPEHMEKDFYELEYIAYEPFAEFLRIFHDRKHVRGIIEDDEDWLNNGDDSDLMNAANTAKFFEKIRSISNNNSRFDELVAFSLIHQACNGIAAAFRHVLKKKQIEEIMNGPGAKKNKKKGINFDELPPIIPNKSTILRVRELREAFKESEKVAGPLLPFCLGASLVKRQQQHEHELNGNNPSPLSLSSRWKEFVPVSCYL